MGICASCLGRQRHEQDEEDDMSRLLFQDGNNMHYGSFGENNMNQNADPMESQRETEALQRVVARLSNNLVDVFDVGPPEPPSSQPPAFAGQDGRIAKYQTILSKLNPEDGAEVADHASGAEWFAGDDDTAYADSDPPTIKEGRDPLVGTFADAPAVA